VSRNWKWSILTIGILNRLNFFKSRIMAPYKIVMVRHGESEWNEKNLFCGWYDANLSEKGKK
jgi:hypothetical protein